MASKYIKCCICGKVVEEMNAHNAEPYKKGLCCSECNSKVVLPARMNLMYKNKGDKNFKNYSKNFRGKK